MQFCFVCVNRRRGLQVRRLRLRRHGRRRQRRLPFTISRRRRPSVRRRRRQGDAFPQVRRGEHEARLEPPTPRVRRLRPDVRRAPPRRRSPRQRILLLRRRRRRRRLCRLPRTAADAPVDDDADVVAISHVGGGFLRPLPSGWGTRGQEICSQLRGESTSFSSFYSER